MPETIAPAGHNDLDLDLNGDRLREECGVFGVFGHPDAAAVARCWSAW